MAEEPGCRIRIKSVAFFDSAVVGLPPPDYWIVSGFGQPRELLNPEGAWLSSPTAVAGHCAFAF
jgi:hypothetical protein